MEAGKGSGRTDEGARAGRATGLGADAVLMRCGGGSEREAEAESSNGLFAGTVGVGVGVGTGVAMGGVGAASGACENGQRVGWVQSALRGHASDRNSPSVENMSEKHTKTRPLHNVNRDAVSACQSLPGHPHSANCSA